MADPWEAASYILSSSYRQRVVSRLAGAGPATTSRLAEQTGISQPHVSRALRELQAEGIVELLVPEERKRGRIYGLTETGERCHRLVDDGADQLAWEIRPPENETEESIVDLLREDASGALRSVGTHGEEAMELFYVREDLRESYSEEDVERLLRIWTEDDADLQPRVAGDLSYQFRGYDAFTLLQVYADERVLTATFDPGFVPGIRDLAEECMGTLGE